MITVSRCSSLALIVLIAAAGCSKGVSLKTVPVSGKVTLDGKPLSGATITFMPQAAAGSAETALTPSSGLTGADGSYKLITMASGREAVDGAPPGNYKVVVTKQTGSGAVANPNPQAAMDGLSDEERAKKMQSMSPEEMNKMRGGAPPGQTAAAPPKPEIPERYSKPDASELTATVGASGPQTFDFPLTSE